MSIKIVMSLTIATIATIALDLEYVQSHNTTSRFDPILEQRDFSSLRSNLLFNQILFYKTPLSEVRGPSLKIRRLFAFLQAVPLSAIDTSGI